MAIIKRYKTKKEAEDAMVDIIENINNYGKMSVKEIVDWIGAEKELSHDPVEVGISFDDIGWLKSATIDFEVDRAKVSYWILLPEPRLLNATMSIRSFVSRKEAEDLLSVLAELIIDCGQLSKKDIFDGLRDSEQRLWYDKDDRNFDYVANPTAEDNDSTGWVTADGVNFKIVNKPDGYWIVLPNPRVLNTPTAIQEALDKGILEEKQPIGGLSVEEAHTNLMDNIKKTGFNMSEFNLYHHNAEEKPLGYFIPYQEGVDRKGALEASLKEMNKGVDGLMHPWELTSEARERLLEGLKEKPLEDYCDEDVKATQQAFENHILRSQANSFYGSASSKKEPPFYSPLAGYIKQRALEREKKDAEFYAEMEKDLKDTLEKVSIEGMKVGQGEKVLTEHGAVRESNEGRGRFDLIPYESMEALAIWSEQGAIKYGDRNWEKGLSVKDCINRLIRHALKAGSGWTDEDHLAAAMWNASAAITMMKRRPDCDDHVWLTKTTGADLQAADEYHNAGLDMESTVAWRERLVAQNAGLGVEFHSCPYCGHMDPKEKWGFYPTLHDTLIYTCKECRKSHEEVIPDEYVHQCSFCGYIEPTSKWKKEPINGYISIYTCKECGKEHEWRDKL